MGWGKHKCVEEVNTDLPTFEILAKNFKKPAESV